MLITELKCFTIRVTERKQKVTLLEAGLRRKWEQLSKTGDGHNKGISKHFEKSRNTKKVSLYFK